MKRRPTQTDAPRTRARCSCVLQAALLSILCATLTVVSGCGTADEKEKKNEFFTSGSHEADQRASQKMAKAEQLSGSGEGAGEKEKKKGDKKSGESGKAEAAEKRALYERLGGEQGVARIVDDFLARAMQDPRVNWQRKGIKRGFFRQDESATWNASPQNVARIKKHIAQFFALATGGPARYEGRDMKSVHGDMKITNSEFDAAVGDLKASLDRLQVPNQEQKELLAIVESTRPQIATER